MNSILIVDTDAENLALIHRLLVPHRDLYETVIAKDNVEALTMFSQRQYDILIADVALPKMDGIILLEKVKQYFPETMRIAMTVRLQKSASLRAAGLAHQFLSKPINQEDFLPNLTRACAFTNLLRDPYLRRILSQARSIPSLPTLYLEILDELEGPSPSSDRVGQIVSKDMGMTAKLLQLVNSAFFGLPRNVTDPVQATVLLGLETVRDLVLSINLFSQFDRTKLERLGLSKLWDHSLSVASLSRRITRSISSNKKVLESAFLGGFLHDVGILLLAEYLTLDYFSAINLASRKHIHLVEAEKDMFGATHCQVGAFLLGLWNLPPDAVEAALYHHDPLGSAVKTASALTSVHICDVLDHDANPSMVKSAPPTLNEQYLKQLGLPVNTSDWKSRL